MEEHNWVGMICVLRYIYTGNYGVFREDIGEYVGQMEVVIRTLPAITPCEIGTETDTYMIRHLYVYKLADMLLMTDLRYLAFERFNDYLLLWKSVMCDKSRSTLIRDPITLCVKEIYEAIGTEELKEAFVDIIVSLCSLGRHVDPLEYPRSKKRNLSIEGMKNLLKEEGFRALMTETNFGADLARRIILENLELMTWVETRHG